MSCELGPAEAAVWVITFALTVFADLTVAVEAGMILAALLYIRRVTTHDDGRAGDAGVHRRGPCATASSFKRSLTTSRSIASTGRFSSGARTSCSISSARSRTLPTVVVLRLRNMTAIDGTGLHALEHFADALHRSGRTLLLCGMRDQPARMMERAEFHQHIGQDNLLPSVGDAIARARALLSDPAGASARSINSSAFQTRSADWVAIRVKLAGPNPARPTYPRDAGQARSRLHHRAVHVGQPEVAALEPVGQLRVVDAEQVQDRRLQVEDGHRISTRCCS